MKNITRFTGLLFVAAIMTFAFSSESLAVPGFARQTGFACNTCHFQDFPHLNAFGRAFKAGGYTQIGAQGKIEDEDLSIPNVLNLSFIVKERFMMTNGDTKAGTDRGNWNIPDEAALMFGGRGGEHVGYMLERGLTSGGGFDNAKVIFPFDLGGTTVAVGTFTTFDQGAAYGFEPLNTGALKVTKNWGEGVDFSAQAYTGLNGTPAAGVVLYAASDLFFVNASLWGPSHEGDIPSGLNLGQYFRAAVTPNVGGWDTAIGAQLWTGETKLGETAAETHVVNGMAVDAQALGQVAGLPLGVYATYATVPKTSTTDGKTYDVGSSAGDRSAMSLSANLSVVPKAIVGLGYRMGNSGATTNSAQNALLVSGTYKIAQNVKLMLDFVSFSGDDSKAENGTFDQRTTLTLFAAF